MEAMQIGPPPQSGINVWMLSSARKCQLAGLPEWEAEQRIMAFNGSARRPFKNNEVRRAVAKAYGTVLAATTEYKRTDKQEWKPSQTRRTTYRPASKEITEADLWECSPIRCDSGLTQKLILNELFPDPNGLLCIGKNTYEFATGRLSQFKNPEKCQFIVPCYMTKKIGLTQEGKESQHCLDNCGPRRFYVCDFDEPKSDDHPSIIWQIRRLFDLVMVISSGGKSLHAWFSVPDDEADDFWKLAISLGADAALMRNRSSFVRIPQGTRENGKTQYAIYFDPTKIPTE